jgi:dTDP-4-amino-4,6-dideoxygalactose transaminase
MRLPVTERVAASTLAFPFLSQFTDDEVSQVADALVEVADVESQG